MIHIQYNGIAVIYCSHPFAFGAHFHFADPELKSLNHCAKCKTIVLPNEMNESSNFLTIVIKDKF